MSAKYKVKKPITTGGNIYQLGSVIKGSDLSKKELDRRLSAGHIVLIEEGKKETKDTKPKQTFTQKVFGKK